MMAIIMLIITIMLINNHPNCRDNTDELLHELTGGVMAERQTAPHKRSHSMGKLISGLLSLFVALINDINRGNINLVKTKNTRVDVYFRVLHEPWRRPLIIASANR